MLLVWVCTRSSSRTVCVLNMSEDPAAQWQTLSADCRLTGMGAVIPYFCPCSFTLQPLCEPPLHHLLSTPRPACTTRTAHTPQLGNVRGNSMCVCVVLLYVYVYMCVWEREVVNGYIRLCDVLKSVWQMIWFMTHTHTHTHTQTDVYVQV